MDQQNFTTNKVQASEEEQTFFFKQTISLIRATKEANSLLLEAKLKLQNIEDAFNNVQRDYRRIKALQTLVSAMSRESAAVVLKMSCSETIQKAFQKYRKNLDISFEDFMLLVETLNDSTREDQTAKDKESNTGCFSSDARPSASISPRSQVALTERRWSTPTVSKTYDKEMDSSSFLDTLGDKSCQRKSYKTSSSSELGEAFPRMSRSDYKEQMVNAIESTHGSTGITPLWEDKCVSDTDDDSDMESYTSKKKQKQSQLIQEHNLRPQPMSDDDRQRDMQVTSWQIQREIIELSSKRKQLESRRKGSEENSANRCSSVDGKRCPCSTQGNTSGPVRLPAEAKEFSAMAQRLSPRSRNQPSVSPLLTKKKQRPMSEKKIAQCKIQASSFFNRKCGEDNRTTINITRNKNILVLV